MVLFFSCINPYTGLHEFRHEVFEDLLHFWTARLPFKVGRLPFTYLNILYWASQLNYHMLIVLFWQKQSWLNVDSHYCLQTSGLCKLLFVAEMNLNQRPKPKWIENLKEQPISVIADQRLLSFSFLFSYLGWPLVLGRTWTGCRYKLFDVHNN